MSIVWTGGVAADFPNGSSVDTTTTAGYFRAGSASGAISPHSAGDVMKSAAFTGGALTSLDLTFRARWDDFSFAIGTLGPMLASAGKGLLIGVNGTARLWAFDSTGPSLTELTIESAGVTAFSPGTLHLIRMHVTNWGASAHVTVYVDGALIMDYTGDVTFGGTVLSVDSLFGRSGNSQAWMSEIVVDNLALDPLFSPNNMTANNAPSPYVVIATSQPINAFNLFNGTTNPWQGSGGGNDWAQLDLGAGNEHELTSYAIQAFDTSTRNPQTWIIQGSNDQAKWDTLDSQTGQTGWATGEIRSYICSSPTTSYRYFRLWVTANNGDVTYTQVGELSLYGITGTPPASTDFAPHTMTNGFMPSPYTVDSDSVFTSFSGPWDAFNAFDGLGLTGSSGWLGNVPAGGWLRIDFGVGASRVLTGYAIRCRINTWAPGAWTFQGSNNGTTWTTLDTQSGVNNWHDTGSWPINEAKYYHVSTATGYRFFRINISSQAVPNAGYGPSISEMYLYGTGTNGTAAIPGIKLSKANVYAVVSQPPGVDVSKANVYAIAALPPGANVSKANVYAVASLPPGVNVSKANVYAIIATPTIVGTAFTPNNMTANNAPSPYVASASSSSGSYPPFSAFSSLPGGGSSPWATSSGPPWYLQIDIGAGNEHVLESYTIQKADAWPGSRMPNTWTVLGSNDGIRWVLLDTQSAQSGWADFEVRIYPTSVGAAYRYFRLLVTANNSGGGDVTTSLGQLRLYGVTGTPVAQDHDFAPHNVTGYTAPPPYVVSSSQDDGTSYASWHVFDGATDSIFVGQPGTFSTTWLSIDLGAGARESLTGYAVRGGWGGFLNDTRAPKNWTMEGSADGITWTVLDTQINQTNWFANWDEHEVRAYPATSPAGYRYFRINITANNSGGADVNTGIFELYLFGFTPFAPGSGVITTAKGTLLKISNVASPAVYVSIGKVRSISGPTTKPKTPDITTHDAPGYWARKLAVLIDGGEANFEVNFDQSDATHSFTTGMWHQLIGLLKSGFQIVFPNGAGTLTFKGYIGQHEFDAPVDNVLSAKIMIAITDDIIAAIP